ncbi:MAG: M15 family peptidase [Gammaproteobacteria bacterium]|nr:MAG: M15 family peptidase [Gammaproteobacteria bacterium]
MPIGIEKLYGLQPDFRTKVEKIIHEMEMRGWSIRIVWGARTYEENQRLVNKGVASPHSKHLLGKAVDLIDRKTGYTENRDHRFYKDLSELARKYGLIWGGNFRSRWDPCHLEAP